MRNFKEKLIATVFYVFALVLIPITARIYDDHHTIHMEYGTQFRLAPESAFSFIYEYRGEDICIGFEGTKMWNTCDKKRTGFASYGYTEDEIYMLNTRAIPVKERISDKCCAYPGVLTAFDQGTLREWYESVNEPVKRQKLVHKKISMFSVFP